MRPLSPEEIAPLAAYAQIRDAYRRAVIAHKRDRRLAVGPVVTLLFEDRETLHFQVQEMLFVERVERAEAVQHEIDVYNELMPGAGELSATLMIEITEPGRIRAELDRLIGLDEHVSLTLGSGDATTRIAARFDAKQFEGDRISAVQYIRFRLDASARALFVDPAVAAALEIDHPAYQYRAELVASLRASLAAGLETEPTPLLPDWSDVEVGPPELVFEGEGVRIVHCEGPPAELVVESLAPLGTLDAAAWRSLLDALRRASLDSIQRHGRAQVEAELSPDAPARWRIRSHSPIDR